MGHAGERWNSEGAEKAAATTVHSPRGLHKEQKTATIREAIRYSAKCDKIALTGEDIGWSKIVYTVRIICLRVFFPG
jgi:hypothetical protein